MAEGAIVIEPLGKNSANYSKVVEDIVKTEKKIFPKHESLSRFFDEEFCKKNTGLLYADMNGEVAGYVMYTWPTSLTASITKLADIFLNRHWEEDFPSDKTGNLYTLEKFVAENFDFCKWIGLSVVAAQGISFLLAMILKALGSVQESYYDYDDDYYSSRLPLLKNSRNGPYVVGEPLYGARV